MKIHRNEKYAITTTDFTLEKWFLVCDQATYDLIFKNKCFENVKDRINCI